VFAIGRPIVNGSPSVVTRFAVDQIVVSVGPYMFHNSKSRSTNASASASGNASPPHNALKPGRPRQPESTSIRQVVGVACITDAPHASINRAN